MFVKKITRTKMVFVQHNLTYFSYIYFHEGF